MLPDVQAASALYMNQSAESKKAILELNSQLTTAQYIRHELTSKSIDQTLPTNSGIANANIETQINNYNNMVLDRNRLISNSSEANPLVQDLTSSLQSMQKTIVQSIDNLILSINSQINSNRQQEATSINKLASSPNQAKYLLSVESQQKVKEALYLYLLQKREENELSQAFTAYNTRVITPPTGSRMPKSPNRKMILLIAIVFGLALPFGIIYLIQTTNTKVRGRKDIEKLSIPLVGEVPLCGAEDDVKNWKKHLLNRHEEKRQLIVVKDGSRDVSNEAFRVLRTNLEFMSAKDPDKNVFIFTSFNPGSGKSFLTLNLAISFAIKGRRVLLVDGDLRHASTSAYVKYPSKGIATYLSHKTDDWKEYVIKDETHPSLDVLPVGKIPPNPTELLEDERLARLVEDARSRYDYVFFDCPPVDIVADTRIIGSLADRTVFIVRAGLFERAMLPELETLYSEKKYSNMCLILNGTDNGSGKYGYRYRYGYRYGYKYGYSSYRSYYGDTGKK